MRRMYSEQELTNVIKAVFEQELEDGALDDKVVDAVDAYLVEHPVDPTAITGLDIAPKDVTASGNITAPSIIEDMDGYSFTPVEDINYLYAGVVKNGNKITFVLFATLTQDGTLTGTTNLGTFLFPSAIGNKLIPYTMSGDNRYLDYKKILFVDASSAVSAEYPSYILKSSSASMVLRASGLNALSNGTYYFRYEVTFLLSDSLISEE